MNSRNDNANPIPDVEIYRVIYDKVPQGVVVVKNDKMQYANQAISDIVGVPLEEIYSWGIDDILGVLAGEDPNMVKTLYQDTAKGIAAEGLLQFSFVHKNGEIRHIEVIPTIISVEGETIYHAIITDVTMRVKAEVALRENEERFRQTFDAIPDPAYVWERKEDGTIALQMVNQAMMQYSRGLAEEYLGRPPEDLFPDNSEMSSMIRTTMDEGGKARAEIVFKISSIPAHAESRRLIVDYTKPAENMVVMITTDVTDVLKAEDAIRESEERLELALKGANLGLWDWNTQTNEMIINDRWADIFGYKIDEIEPTFEMWKDLVHPEDWPWISDIVDSFLRGESSYDVEYRAKTKSGDWIWVLDRGKIVEWDKKRKPIRAVGTLMDNTPRKQMEKDLQESEERFRSMAESIQDGVTIMEGSPVVYVNDRACEIFGYPREEFMKVSTLDLVAPEERERVGAIIASSMAIREFPNQLDFWTVRKDGTRRHVSNRFAFTTKDDGTPIQFVITTDITERMMAYEAVIEARERAELFNDLMAHDLNNIHQGIMSSLELILMSGNLSQKLMTQVEVALEQVNRGSEIIGNVRKFSRVIQEPLELATFDIDSILLTAEVMVTSTFPDKKISVNASFKKGDFKVLADNFLVDALFNILHNAVKHDQSNEVTIDVKAKVTDDNKTVDLMFEDYGPGIKDSKKASLFSRVKKDGEVGAGIGLTLVQRIVRRYGGDVGVEDRVKGDYSKGACFIVKLHIAK